MAAPPADLQRVVWCLGLGLPPLEHCHRLSMQRWRWRWQAVRQWHRMQHGHCSHQERLQRGDNEATIDRDGPSSVGQRTAALECGGGEESRTDQGCMEESWTSATDVELEVVGWRDEGLEGWRVAGCQGDRCPSSCCHQRPMASSRPGETAARPHSSSPAIARIVHGARRPTPGHLS